MQCTAVQECLTAARIGSIVAVCMGPYRCRGRCAGACVELGTRGLSQVPIGVACVAMSPPQPQCDCVWYAASPNAACCCGCIHLAIQCSVFTGPGLARHCQCVVMPSVMSARFQDVARLARLQFFIPFQMWYVLVRRHASAAAPAACVCKSESTRSKVWC